ncbi:MAG: diguanylate cyclase [Coriobacteriia bacterium]|nr:diguanylate cyclase [Coriobacteriia bacterium]
MQEILELCVRIDTLAHATYQDMAARCTDAEVSRVLSALAVEEATHVGWWQEILESWEAGLVPDIWAGTADVLKTLHGIANELEASQSGSTAPLSAEDALTTAVRIEFFALDPIFSDMLDLAEPAVSRTRQEAYNRHVERLIAAVEHHFPDGSLPHFLAHVLRRAQRENRVLSRFATRDPLTALANRRALTAYLNQWTSWASRYGHPVALLLVDVDRFKSVNDTYGHTVGDQVLSQVAGALAITVRGSDLASRFGGDEFAVIAPELDAEAAVALGERILEAIRAVDVTTPGGSVRVTASVGVAVVEDPPESPARPIDHLLSAADMSLYGAKQAGRDRIGEPVALSVPGHRTARGTGRG